MLQISLSENTLDNRGNDHWKKENYRKKQLAYLESRNLFLQKKADFLKRWNENFLRMDMNDFRGKYDQVNRRFFGKKKALDALTAELQAYAEFPVETDRIPVYLTDVSFFQKEQQEIAEAESALPYEWKQVLKKYDTFELLQQYRTKIREQKQVLKQYETVIDKLERSGKLENCIQCAEKLQDDWQCAKKAEQAADELLKLDFSVSQSERGWLESRLELCKCILEHADALKDWIIYRQYDEECRTLGLSPVCDAYANGLSHDSVMNVYLRSVYRELILSVIETEPVLNEFTGIGFHEKIDQFKKMDQEFMELTKTEMFHKLTHQLPRSGDSVEVSKELNILRRAISSNGRGISVRSLFEQIPHILPRLCPCMLMSPISAAQYLRAENNLMDIVIFDEASQLPTCKAIGVLARGTNAVIVGDPNQMPPTSFFAGNTVDEDNLDLEDLDSILDDCLALGMPSAYLHWHYRSRHESLIAFSNREFYENSMLTFPSVNDREKRVRMVRTDGFFDRGKGRVNEGEAQAIIREIRSRYEDPMRTKQTIGVVTFNISQQTLIEDLLQAEFQKDAAFDQWANTGEEPLFVKNLENVQGDERDIILFSIAFGPDAEGKLSLNFGPLNKDGGWKRLNVAVSRARYEMVVFTTMTSDMIDLRRTKSKGVEALKDFLEFAQKGRLQGEYVETHLQKNQGILEHVCQAIKEAGYQYQKSVGHSKFKIDIAVINPYEPEEYLLGIMLDGESYRQSSNTKDREVAQANVLTGLGWELYRIWTMDWWDNRERELSKLREVLEEKKKAAEKRYLEHQNLEEEEALKKAETLKKVESTLIPETENVLENVSGIEMASEPVSNQSQESALETVPKSEQSQSVTDDAEQEEQRILELPIDLLKDNAIQNRSEKENRPIQYQVIMYVAAETEAAELSGADYVKKENLPLIIEKMQQILDAEAPISYERLVKKTLRAFHIVRSSPQTLEVTDKAMKKVAARLNKQAGVKFYWRKDQDPERYAIYRMDEKGSDKRSVEEICQQEMKNAVCVALQEKGVQSKEELLRNTIRVMGYSRSSTALLAAAERGLKYGRKTGEIIINEEKDFILNQDNEMDSGRM